MSAISFETAPPSPLHGSYAYTDTLKSVYYGPGSVKTELPKLLKLLGGSKALIVTGKSLYNKVGVLFSLQVDDPSDQGPQTDVVKQVKAILEDHGAYGATFYEIGQHSPIAGIREAIKVYTEAGCDIIVSVGGGSPIDASKAVLYFIQQQNGGPTPKQIAIPTTLSAAEYSVSLGVLAANWAQS